jgi:hypothetical protein
MLGGTTSPIAAAGARPGPSRSALVVPLLPLPLSAKTPVPILPSHPAVPVPQVSMFDNMLFETAGAVSALPPAHALPLSESECDRAFLQLLAGSASGEPPISSPAPVSMLSQTFPSPSSRSPCSPPPQPSFLDCISSSLISPVAVHENALFSPITAGAAAARPSEQEYVLPPQKLLTVSPASPCPTRVSPFLPSPTVLEDLIVKLQGCRISSPPAAPGALPPCPFPSAGSIEELVFLGHSVPGGAVEVPPPLSIPPLHA